MRKITALLELALAFIWIYDYHGWGSWAGALAIVLGLAWAAAEMWG